MRRRLAAGLYKCSFQPTQQAQNLYFQGYFAVHFVDSLNQRGERILVHIFEKVRSVFAGGGGVQQTAVAG